MTSIDVFYQGEGIREIAHFEATPDHTFAAIKIATFTSFIRCSSSRPVRPGQPAWLRTTKLFSSLSTVMPGSTFFARSIAFQAAPKSVLTM